MLLTKIFVSNIEAAGLDGSFSYSSLSPPATSQHRLGSGFSGLWSKRYDPYVTFLLCGISFFEMNSIVSVAVTP